MAKISVAPVAAPVAGPAVGLPGRRGQAVRNDTVILDAAREVFLADPKAPIAAVAERAGVGISALYRRYASKEDLLRRLCHDGLVRFITEAEAAVPEAVVPGVAAVFGDGWESLREFVERLVDADVHSLTVHLAGTFTPTPEMNADAVRAGVLSDAIFARAAASGRMRPDAVPQDVGQILEACAAIRLPDPVRTKELRRRHLALQLDGLHASAAQAELPGPPPEPAEMAWRWQQ
jgi:AcrR family transcriptional regulator